MYLAINGKNKKTNKEMHKHLWLLLACLPKAVKRKILKTISNNIDSKKTFNIIDKMIRIINFVTEIYITSKLYLIISSSFIGLMLLSLFIIVFIHLFFKIAPLNKDNTKTNIAEKLCMSGTYFRRFGNFSKSGISDIIILR